MRARARFYATVAEYRSLAWIATHVPRSILRNVASFAGLVGPRIAKGQSATVGTHLAKVTGERASQQQIQNAYASYVRYWFDAFRVTAVSKEEIETLVHVEGWSHLGSAIEAGNGVIVALPHIGNWDVAGAWLLARDVPLTVVAELLEPPEMFEWFKQFRSSLGMDVVANGPRVGAELLAALKQSHVVALLCDRDVDGTGGEYEFFGEVTRLPKGPATLAMRSGAALVPVAMFEDGERYRLCVMPAISTKREGKLSEDVNRVTKELIAALESLIRQAPEQWHVFQPNWPTMEKKRSEAKPSEVDSTQETQAQHYRTDTF